MAPHIFIRDREMVVPNSPEHNSSTTNQIARCSHPCSIALGTVLPIIALAVILTMAYFAWYVPKQAQLRRQRADEERIRKKLGGREEEEESVASSDVSSLDGQVYGLNEESRGEGKMEMGRQTQKQQQQQQQTRKVEEGHEHDHVLAMITARP